jgi:Tfp pilus assembly protein PilN
MSATELYDRINFLPQWYADQQRRRRMIERQAALGVLLVAGMVALWVLTDRQRDDLRLHRDSLATQVLAAETQLTEVAKLQKAEQALSTQLRVFDQLARPITFHQVGSALGTLTPESVFLSRLEAKTSTIQQRVAIHPAPDEVGAPTSKIINKEVILITLRGSAPSNVEIANYVGRLAGSNLFRNVKMMNSRQVIVEDAVTRQFEIQMQIPLDREYRVEAGVQEVAHAGE